MGPVPSRGADPGAPTPLELIWRHMSRPFNLVRAVPTLTGIPSVDVADLVALHLAISDEADALLAHVPTILRSLASSTSTEIERSIGNMRGPIMWAETLTARANTFGADDVFVCAAPRRDYDISENRTLVAALEIIARARLSADSSCAESLPAETRARIDTNVVAARALLRHRFLAEVRHRRVPPREVHKVASGRRAKQYGPALDMLARRSEPLRGDELHHLCDERTRAQHRALVLVGESLRRRGLAVPQYQVNGQELVAGRLRYRNWHQPTAAGNHGILIDAVLVDSPVRNGSRGTTLAELERRAGGRRFCLVDSPEDADVAVSLALEGTRWQERSGATIV